jgi:exosortase/archaeosortase family protein
MAKERKMTKIQGPSKEKSMRSVDDTLKESKFSRKRCHNDKLMITTIIFASITAFVIYTVPDWVFLEIPIRNLVQLILSFIGIISEPIPTNGEFIIPMELRGGPFPFLEATEQTPGVILPATQGRYYITKTCTAMQAGALLLGIIFVTETSWKSKVKASTITFVVLFFLNVLRISFHFWTITILYQNFNMDAETAFYWGHDVSSKIIGFIGTIILALLIEKLDVPIIDQFADWLDYLWWKGNSMFGKIDRR